MAKHLLSIRFSFIINLINLEYWLMLQLEPCPWPWGPSRQIWHRRCDLAGNQKAQLRSETDNQVEQCREEKVDRWRSVGLYKKKSTAFGIRWGKSSPDASMSLLRAGSPDNCNCSIFPANETIFMCHWDLYDQCLHSTTSDLTCASMAIPVQLLQSVNWRIITTGWVSEGVLGSAPSNLLFPKPWSPTHAKTIQNRTPWERKHHAINTIWTP